VSNFNDMPNSVHHSGDVSFGSRFGGLVNCRAVNLPGIGHHAHIEARFLYGVKLEFDRATAIEFARALTESVNALPPVVDFTGGNCSGITAELGEI
jgi:hypothetical protein